MKQEILKILTYQQTITNQGINYTGEKDWALNKLLKLFESEVDLAVSKERGRIVGEVKKRSSFFKTIVSEWGDIYIDIVKGITEDDIINLINTK